MKNTLMLIAAALISFASAASHAQNYYVCDSGNDSNNGLSESTPFKTFAKGMQMFGKISGGDSILFCRGGKFSVSTNTRLVNWKCSADAYCTIADYGNSNLPRPLIVSNNANVFNFEEGGSADEDGGYIIKNLAITSTTHTMNAFRFFNDVNDVIIDNVYVDGMGRGIYLAGSNTPSAGSNGLNDRITIKNSVIKNSENMGLLGGGNDLVIENNTFEGNGSLALKDHNIYVNNPSHDTAVRHVTIQGNTLYKSDMNDGKCQGVSLVVHGKVDNILIEGNTIKEDSGTASQFCWGIGVNPGYFTEEAFHNVVIRNNSILNMGNVGIGCASCVGVQISGNKIVDDSQVMAWGIKTPVSADNTEKTKDVSISNNTVILSKPTGYGIYLGGDYPFSATNNTISQPADASVPCIQRTDANKNTNISSNICTKNDGISLIDSQTGQTVSSTDVSSVGSVSTGTNASGSTSSSSMADFNQLAMSRLSSSGTTNTATTDSGTVTNSNATDSANSSTMDDFNNLAMSRAATSGSINTTGTTNATTSTQTSTANTTSTMDELNQLALSRTGTATSTSTDSSTSSTDSNNTTAMDEFNARAISRLTTVQDVNNASQTDYANVDPSTCRATSSDGTCLMY